MSVDTKQALSRLISDPLLEELELQLRQPNFFYLLSIQGAEIRHSNFLAWLLDPKQNHGLGDLALRRFLRDVFSSGAFNWMTEFDVDQLDLTQVEIRREWQRIDLLVVSDQFVICIENKVLSSEHSDQLKRYRQTVATAFPKRNHAFVFLTPEGIEPQELEDAEVYQAYSYRQIESILSSILRIHGNSLSKRNRIYIEDYQTVLRRGIMKDDAVNQLARQVYESHREALDFIFEHKPDRLAEVGPIFEKMVESSGWVLVAKRKGIILFLTKKLQPIIPVTGTGDGKNKRIFYFFFEYWPTSSRFGTGIQPGQESHRQILADILGKVPGAGSPKGKQWLVHFSKPWKFDVTNVKLTDEDIQKKLEKVWPKVEKLVERVEAAILEKQDLLPG